MIYFTGFNTLLILVQVEEELSRGVSHPGLGYRGNKVGPSLNR